MRNENKRIKIVIKLFFFDRKKRLRFHRMDYNQNRLTLAKTKLIDTNLPRRIPNDLRVDSQYTMPSDAFRRTSELDEVILQVPKDRPMSLCYKFTKVSINTKSDSISVGLSV